MDNISIFGDDFDGCLAHLAKILEVCMRKLLVLSWEKSYCIEQQALLLRHLVSSKSIEVDKAKIEVIQKLPLHIDETFSWGP